VVIESGGRKAPDILVTHLLELLQIIGISEADQRESFAGSAQAFKFESYACWLAGVA
jgi:hypothetical protein